MTRGLVWCGRGLLITDVARRGFILLCSAQRDPLPTVRPPRWFDLVSASNATSVSSFPFDYEMYFALVDTPHRRKGVFEGMLKQVEADSRFQRKSIWAEVPTIDLFNFLVNKFHFKAAQWLAKSGQLNCFWVNEEGVDHHESKDEVVVVVAPSEGLTPPGKKEPQLDDFTFQDFDHDSSAPPDELPPLLE